MGPKALIAVLACAAASFSGCAHLQLAERFSAGAGDWPMYGRAQDRANSAASIVEPPLEAAWEYDASAGFGTSSAAAAGGFVLAANLRGEVHAVDIMNGEGRGSRDFGSAISGTPVISGDTLYAALAHDEHSLVAYALHTGSVVWQAALGDIESSPLLSEGRLFAASLHGTMFSVDRRTGAILWRYRIPEAPLIHSSPASDGAMVVFGCDNGSVCALSAPDGRLLWKARTRAAVLASPVITDGAVFVGSQDSSFYAFDTAAGGLLWSQRLGAKIFSSAAVRSGRVYAGTSGGEFFCLDARTGSVVWRFSMNSVPGAAPVASGDIVYAGCLDRTLYAFEAATGRIAWKCALAGRLKTAPIVYRDLLILLVEDRSVIAMRHSGGQGR